MIGHDQARRLAASALDFQLAGPERAELRDHLAGCDACRRHAELLRRDAVAFEHLVASAAVREGAGQLARDRVLAAAAASDGRASAARLTLQAAVLLVVMLLLLTLGAVLFAGSRARLSAIEPAPTANGVEGRVTTTVDVSGRLPPEPDYCRISSGEHRTPDCRIGVAAGADSIWATAGRGIVRVDPAAGNVRAAIELQGDPRDIVFLDGLLYVATWAGTLDVVDPSSDTVTARIPVSDRPLDAIAVDPQGDLWVTVRASGEAVHVDPRGRSVVGRVQVSGEPYDIEVAGGSAWVTDRVGDRITRIDRSTGRVSDRLTLLNFQPRDIVATSSGLWVAGGSELALLDPASGAALQRVPGPLWANLGAGASELWVVSLAGLQAQRADAADATVLGRASVAGVVHPPDPEAAVVVADGAAWIATYGSPGLIQVRAGP